ncbi:MAG: DUF4335 domain-containing protein [Leptolyngbyaceae cyanobacterium HOT.MB2.61]|nr:DUF4335 domain-containing protein [Leptolyngbyaceae cyanobacterium HOT.MB2.61]
MSHSVLRRYTPPTCTLEIIGSHSPLSRWMAQPVLKNLRFQLSLDDPKVPKDQWVTLRGDRAQLEALCEAVSTYVQHFLEQSYKPADELVLASQVSAIAPARTIKEEFFTPQATQPNAAGIVLQPKGLLTHELVLGSLATEETGPVVRLSALQLFDLANALDEYTAEMVTLPNLQPARSGWLKSSPGWVQIAAVCLVVVGLSTSVVKLLDRSLRPNPTTLSQGASSRDQQVASQLPSATTENVPPPAVSSQKLPPPPPSGSTIPATPSMPRVSVPSTLPTSPGAGSGETAKGAAGPTTASRDRPPVQSPNSIALNEAGPGNQSNLPAPVFKKPEPADGQAARRTISSAAIESAGQATLRVKTPQSADSTAFDTIPQVAEARRYFQQRWTPPEGLNQTIEYTLVVNPDGSIQQILPLGQTAGDYIDRTNIPLVGEPFVSSIKGGRTARIRLVLSPDGKVRTFLEQLY